MKYEDMSDFEINCRVHAEVMQISGLNSFKAKDYCNNPSDAWPVITGNNISIVATDSEWISLPDNAVIDGITGDATSMIYVGDECVIGKNPLRAAMIVFLRTHEVDK